MEGGVERRGRGLSGWRSPTLLQFRRGRQMRAGTGEDVTKTSPELSFSPRRCGASEVGWGRKPPSSV